MNRDDMPLHVSVEMKLGRLLEIRVKSGFRTVADVDAMFQQITVVLAANMPAAAPGAAQKHVTVADWRQCVLMSGEAAARLQEGMAQTNPNVLRAAALASKTSPSTVMQFLRIIRNSDHEDRRLFFEEVPLLQWLAQVLTPIETARLRQFLRER
jgi:hypothetical protein